MWFINCKDWTLPFDATDGIKSHSSFDPPTSPLNLRRNNPESTLSVLVHPTTLIISSTHHAAKEAPRSEINGPFAIPGGFFAGIFPHAREEGGRGDGRGGCGNARDDRD